MDEPTNDLMFDLVLEMDWSLEDMAEVLHSKWNLSFRRPNFTNSKGVGWAKPRHYVGNARTHLHLILTDMKVKSAYYNPFLCTLWHHVTWMEKNAKL